MSSHRENAVSIETLRQIAAEHGFSLRPQDESGYLRLTQAVKESVDFVSQLPDYIDAELTPDLGLKPSGERTYTAPPSSENPLNAWSHRVRIEASKPTSDLLAGKTVAIKDNASVAGVPLTGGTQPFHLSKAEPYPVPSLDAVAVTRVLAAGGTVTGTATCENYCMSARSVTSATGPVHNPWLRGYDSGGSSSGSAALVAINVVKRWREARGLPAEDLREGVDLALGGDQGGSIRVPAAHCGVYGLKPTHGLVPYTGIASLHPLLDHAGPIAATVRDTALMLTALAGYDGLDDARMTPEAPLRSDVPQYHALLDAAIAERQAAGSWSASAAARGLRVGILKEAFEMPGLDAEVSAVVRRAADRFRALGADAVSEVSVPAHKVAQRLFLAATVGHGPDVLIYGTAPLGRSFPYPAAAAAASDDDDSQGRADAPEPEPEPEPEQQLTQGWYDAMTRSNPMVPSLLLSGEYIKDRKRYAASVRDKALRHVHELRAAYDRALREFDVLVMPATLTVGPRHPAEGELGVAEMGEFLLRNVRNTEPFNLTGHPALVVPVGWGKVEDGDGKLPVGMQIVGKRWAEEKLFFAAAAWEVGGLGLDEE